MILINKKTLRIALALMVIVYGCASVSALTKEGEGKEDIYIEAIKFSQDQDKSVITVEASKPFTYTVFKEDTPPKIVVEIPDIRIDKLSLPIKVGRSGIDSITALRDEKRSTTKIEIRILENLEFNARKEQNILYIELTGFKHEEASSPASSNEVKEEKAEEKKEGIIEVSSVAEKPQLEEKEKESTIETQESEKEKGETEKKSVEKTRITAIEIHEKKQHSEILIKGDRAFADINSFKLQKPERIVIDIRDSDRGKIPSTIKGKGRYVKRIRVGVHEGKVRVVIEPVKKLPPFAVEKRDGEIVVLMGKALPSTAKLLKKEKEPNIVKAIDFKYTKEKSRIVIETVGKMRFDKSETAEDILSIQIKNAFIPARLQRTFDTSEFISPVKFIAAYQSKTASGEDVSVVIKLKEKSLYEITEEGNKLIVSFNNPPSIAKVEEKAPQVEKKEIAQVPEEKVERKEERVEVEKKQEKVEEQKVKEEKVVEAPVEKKAVPVEGEGKVYTGQRISLDFKDADIKNVFRLIAEVSNLNIIAGDDVKGKITIRLINVPWDQALDIILQTNALGMKRVGNVIWIAPKTRIKAEEEAEMEAKRKKEKLEDLVIKTIPINYAKASDMAKQIKSLLSERGSVDVDERTSRLIIKDIPKNIESAVSLIKTLDIPTPQVLIEAKIVEASTDFSRELGIQWGAVGITTSQHTTIGVSGSNPPGSANPLSSPTASTLSPFVVNAPASAGLGTGMGLAFGILRDNFRLDLVLSALENEGRGRVISSPKIVTLDNKEAVIQQGTSIPFETTSAAGTQTQFIDANLNLTVTPHITPDGSVIMKIKASRNAPNTAIRGASGAPSIDKREAVTELLVRDGETAVLGGIYVTDTGYSESGVPWLRKIPVFGWFFQKYTQRTKGEELLLFVTPRIIRREQL